MFVRSSFLLCLFSLDLSLSWSSLECWDSTTSDLGAQHILLYSTLGTYSKFYLDMLQIMIKTSAFHFGKQADITIVAHHSWSPMRQIINVSHFILLNEETFFDMGRAHSSALPPSVPSQSSANKLRIFQLMPSAKDYDVIIMLDADIIVQANFLLLLGQVCRDTLYVVSHRVAPEEGKGQKHFQSRSFNHTEVSHLKTKDLYFFNAGQFLFRPSAYMEDRFHRAYLSYKLNPQASLYEQGHLNTVFLLEGNVKYTLTHLTLLGLTPALWASLPAAYALIHVCDYTASPAMKLAGMQRHLGTAFRPLEAVRRDILPRLWRCLDTFRECGIFTARFRQAPAKGRSKPGPVVWDSKRVTGSFVAPRGNLTSSLEVLLPEQPSIPIEELMVTSDLIASYSRFVSQPNVTRMCEAGFHRGRPAAIALVANPAAGLAVFNPEGPATAAAVRKLRGIFPSRVIHLAGELEDLLRNYGALVRRGQQPPCSTFLLPDGGPGAGLWQTLAAIQAIMDPPGHVFTVGAAPLAPSGWPAAVANGAIRETVCHDGTVGGRGVRWCTGTFQLA